jgi:hypothetical protein
VAAALRGPWVDWPTWVRLNYTAVSSAVVRVPEQTRMDGVYAFAREVAEKLMAGEPVTAVQAYDVVQRGHATGYGDIRLEALLDAFNDAFPHRDGRALRADYAAANAALYRTWVLGLSPEDFAGLQKSRREGLTGADY